MIAEEPIAAMVLRDGQTSGPTDPIEFPQAGWVPLREAPFRFRAGRNEKGGFSEGTSLDDLGATLTEISGASEAHVNAKAQTFDFGFIEPMGSYVGGPPWLILSSAERRKELIEPPLDPEMLFDKNFRYVDDEERRVERRQHRAMVLATGVVWRRTMVPEFNNAVEAGQITLFARPTARGPFQPVPPDVWPSYEIRDWETGYAIGSDSSTLLSIHAAPLTFPRRTDSPSVAPNHVAPRPSPQIGAPDSGSPSVAPVQDAPRPYARPGRAPEYDYEKIRGQVFRLFQSKGMPHLENDTGWRTGADLRHELEAFCESVFGRRPARSTLDGLVDRAIQDWNSREQVPPDKGK